MALYTPTPAGPTTLRLFFHWIWAELTKIGVAIGSDDGSSPPTHAHDHDALLNVTPDQHHNQAHLLWGSDHSDVDSGNAITSLQIIRYDGAQFIADRRTKVHGGGVLPANNISLPGDIWFNNGTGQPSPQMLP